MSDENIKKLDQLIARYNCEDDGLTSEEMQWMANALLEERAALQSKLDCAVEALEELEQLERGHETYKPGDPDEPRAHRVAREALAKLSANSIGHSIGQSTQMADRPDTRALDGLEEAAEEYVDGMINRSPTGKMAFKAGAKWRHAQTEKPSDTTLIAKRALVEILTIENRSSGTDWEEIEQARNIAAKALAEIAGPLADAEKDRACCDCDGCNSDETGYHHYCSSHKEARRQLNLPGSADKP